MFATIINFKYKLLTASIIADIVISTALSQKVQLIYFKYRLFAVTPCEILE